MGVKHSVFYNVARPLAQAGKPSEWSPLFLARLLQQCSQSPVVRTMPVQLKLPDSVSARLALHGNIRPCSAPADLLYLRGSLEHTQGKQHRLINTLDARHSSPLNLATLALMQIASLSLNCFENFARLFIQFRRWKFHSSLCTSIYRLQTTIAHFCSRLSEISDEYSSQ